MKTSCFYLIKLFAHVHILAWLAQIFVVLPFALIFSLPDLGMCLKAVLCNNQSVFKPGRFTSSLPYRGRKKGVRCVICNESLCYQNLRNIVRSNYFYIIIANGYQAMERKKMKMYFRFPAVRNLFLKAQSMCTKQII